MVVVYVSNSIFSVDFWELSHLTRDLSQAEKKNILFLVLSGSEVQNCVQNEIFVRRLVYFITLLIICCLQNILGVQQYKLRGSLQCSE